jgi:drug/metabolite transporter (DMT)-like permease
VEPGIGYAVAAAAAFGGGDFSGGLATRRVSVLVVVAGAQLSGLVVLALAFAVVSVDAPTLAGLALAIAAGLAGAIGLASLYRGMAIGRMGLVAALAGAGSLVLPLLVSGLLQGAVIGPPQLVGVACAAAAGAAASSASRGTLQRTALALAGAAALGFGAWYVLLDLAAQQGELWALVTSRTAASLASLGLLVARGVPPLPGGRLAAIVLLAGVLDVAGNAFYVLASGSIPVGLAAALTGLYPVVTMLLARVFVGERLPRTGYLGVALALAAIVLISLG